MTKQPVVGIFLAAGKSSRMGQNKLLLPWENSTVASTAFRAGYLSNLDHIVIVTKEADTLDWLDPLFLDQTNKQNWTHVFCEDAYKGQAHSLQCGVNEAERLGAKAIVVLLADQPLIRPIMVNALISQYDCHDRVDYVASCLNGKMRPPILFSKTMFPLLMKLSGDEGARNLLREYPSNKGLTIDYNDWSVFYDIDTEEDYTWIKTVHH